MTVNVAVYMHLNKMANVQVIQSLCPPLDFRLLLRFIDFAYLPHPPYITHTYLGF